MPFTFFFSYTNANYDQELLGFFNELENEVKGLMSQKAAGFFAPRNIGHGQVWPPELATALVESDVLVCVYSADYFQSDYCGKEVQVFLDRRKKYIKDYPGHRPANILPVYWWPVDPIPLVVRRFQHNAEPGSLYKQEGLKYVRALSNKDAQDAYVGLRRSFARNIRDAAQKHKLPSMPPPKIASVRNAFEPMLPLPDADAQKSVGPDAVTFVFAGSAAHGADSVCAAVVEANEMEAQQIPFDAADNGLLGKIKGSADRGNVTVLVVDAASLGDPQFAARMHEIDGAKLVGLATLVVWPQKPQAQAADAIFAHSKGKPVLYYRNDIDSAETLATVLESSIAAVQADVVNNPVAPKDSVPSSFSLLPSLPSPGVAGAFAHG